jgi:hypothetical protein
MRGFLEHRHEATSAGRLMPYWLGADLPQILFPQANSDTVDHLEKGKPLQRFEVTIAILERNDSVLVPWVLQCKRHLSFHPHGVDSIRGEKHYKPAAALQCTEDLILPLPGSDNILRAEERRNTVTHQSSGETLCQLPDLGASAKERSRLVSLLILPRYAPC